MNNSQILIAAVLVLLVGGLLAWNFARRKRSAWFQDKFGPEYDRTVKALGSEKKAQEELQQRQQHVATFNIRPLSFTEGQRYRDEWTSVQAKFVDQPRQAIEEADHLIMEVMNLRDYPVADFEQRAADLSIQYPTLVTNYRAAREVAINNEQHHAGTEDLRRAFINYRSLFDELLKSESAAAD